MGKCENFNFSKLAQNKFPVCPDCRKNIHLSDSGIDIYFENKKLNEFYNVKIEAKKFIKIYGENQKSCDYIFRLTYLSNTSYSLQVFKCGF